jgi:hypothetical protein
MQGTVEKVTTGPDGMLTSLVTSTSGAQEIHSHYIIDCTGLEADISEHRVLADLLAHGGAGRNPLGRLEIERHFEVKGTRGGDGALYASGATTLGGYFPGVDTFLGLQVAAQEIADDLARHGFAKEDRPRPLRRPVVQMGLQPPGMTRSSSRGANPVGTDPDQSHPARHRGIGRDRAHHAGTARRWPAI